MLAGQIAERGLFGFANEQRTYGYPFFLALCARFFAGGETARDAFVVGVQGIALVAAAAVAARRFTTPTRRGPLLVFCAVALQPFALVHASEPMPDLLSAALVLLALAFSVGARPRAFLAFFFAGAAAVVRPADAIVAIALAAAWAFRAARAGDVRIVRAAVLGLIGLAIPLSVQLASNLRAYGTAEPLVVSHLYGNNVRDGVKWLKYATLVHPGSPPQIAYGNPLAGDANPAPAGEAAASGFLRRRPAASAATALLHGFAMHDQDLPFTYVLDPRPWYRWVSTLAGFLLLAFAALGLAGARRSAWRPRDRADVAAVLCVAGFYVALHLPTVVESRYALPVFLVLAPFTASGAAAAADTVRRGKTAEKVRLLAGFAVWLAASVALSAWISAQAPALRGAEDRSPRTNSVRSERSQAVVSPRLDAVLLLI